MVLVLKCKMKCVTYGSGTQDIRAEIHCDPKSLDVCPKTRNVNTMDYECIDEIIKYSDRGKEIIG